MLATNDIEEASKKVDLAKENERLEKVIEEASTQIQSLVIENIDLNEDNGNLRAEVRNLKDCLKQWQDSIEK